MSDEFLEVIKTLQSGQVPKLDIQQTGNVGLQPVESGQMGLQSETFGYRPINESDNSDA